MTEEPVPLPKHEDRFEEFYIRYDVQSGDDEGMNIAIDAEVWEVCEWTEDGKPVFFNAGPLSGTDKATDPRQNKPLFHFRTQWDSCSHLRMPYFHFDGIEEFEKLCRVVKYIYDDICDRHNVSG